MRTNVFNHVLYFQDTTPISFACRKWTKKFLMEIWLPLSHHSATKAFSVRKAVKSAKGWPAFSTRQSSGSSYPTVSYCLRFLRRIPFYLISTRQSSRMKSYRLASWNAPRVFSCLCSNPTTTASGWSWPIRIFISIRMRITSVYCKRQQVYVWLKICTEKKQYVGLAW